MYFKTSPLTLKNIFMFLKRSLRFFVISDTTRHCLPYSLWSMNCEICCLLSLIWTFALLAPQRFPIFEHLACIFKRPKAPRSNKLHTKNCPKSGWSGWNWMRVDGSGESGWKWQWVKVDAGGESGCRWMKVDESGESGCRWLSVVENIRGATSISDGFKLHSPNWPSSCPREIEEDKLLSTSQFKTNRERASRKNLHICRSHICHNHV